MGKIKQGILGGYSGKVGTTIGTSWKGQAVIKAMPLSVAQPNTQKKINSEARFTYITSFCRSILVDTIKPLLDRIAIKCSGFNMFSKMNKHCFTKDGLVWPEELIISLGKLYPLDDGLTKLIHDTHLFTLEWPDAPINSISGPDDILHGCIMKESTGIVMSIPPTAQRSDKILTFEIPDDWFGTDAFHIWLAFRSSNGLETSNTYYTYLQQD